MSPNAKSQVKIKVRSQPDQGKISKSNVRYVEVIIWGSAYPVQSRAITLKIGAQDNNYQSEYFVGALVIRGVM